MIIAQIKVTPIWTSDNGETPPKNSDINDQTEALFIIYLVDFHVINLFPVQRTEYCWIL